MISSLASTKAEFVICLKRKPWPFIGSTRRLFHSPTHLKLRLSFCTDYNLFTSSLPCTYLLILVIDISIPSPILLLKRWKQLLWNQIQPNCLLFDNRPSHRLQLPSTRLQNQQTQQRKTRTMVMAGSVASFVGCFQKPLLNNGENWLKSSMYPISCFAIAFPSSMSFIPLG